ncbi:MAG: DNA-directed RNA polymerase subunit omega [Alphaproteobacteria bacterium]|nr:DNA-directed RNA polymerase subunit omega [Alphaproteobacteria bacterium]MBN2780272.1 DNA-directed RNA polymerase subunit omega [Alphaproteobacteria bacterium]
MARLTITDCLQKVKDKYELIVLASRRSRQRYDGASSTIDVDDRVPVTSLREIALETVDIDALRKDLVQSYRHTKDPVVLEKSDEKSDELKQIEAELS